MRDYWELSGPFGLAVRAAVRIFQFIFAIVTIGLYAASLASWDYSTNVSTTNWILALVPAVLSALTCAYHVFATVTHAAWSVWDFGLSVIWAALCGASSTVLVGGENGNFVTGYIRSRLAAGAWIAGVSMTLRLLSAIHSCAYCCASRKWTTTTKQERDKDDMEELPDRSQREV
ncbi:hypothetical protein CSHISOI_09290 [Colletotrichum shisoi]|uniref:MARVEL domain-containing protein n=1 Tax=Colletotrichum shisoi TaxID=2078593 RepID=A0A5Q4BHT5_9PEZI|nr:hypothetical protein CSHISOI_09290 [Colletotrichum shisoi]